MEAAILVAVRAPLPPPSFFQIQLPLMIPQVDYCLVRPSPFTFMARFSKVRTNHRSQQLHGSPALHIQRCITSALQMQRCITCDSHMQQIGNLDETESLMAQYLVDTTLTDMQFLTERPR
jgi:hypothetical protein